MKSIIIFVISLIAVQVTNAQYDKVFATVDGLGCPFCANGLERTFRDMKQKKQFDIDLEKSTMTFLMPTDYKVSVEDILTRVDKAGYTTTSVRIERENGKEVVWSKDQAKEKEEEMQAYAERIIAVSGNCGMCKTRIENAVNELDGIFFAFWNQETQKLHVRFNESLVSQKEIEEHVAAVGHDTEHVKAEDHVYENLHGCCLYERKL
jgi:mercuric ion binding protein